MKIRYFFFILVFLSSTSCEKNNDPQSNKTISIGNEVTLALHQTVTIQPNFVKLTLEEITDNRCPFDLLCIWEGRTVVKFIAKGIGEDLSIELTENERPNLEPQSTAKVMGLTVKMIEVTPWPESTNSIMDEDYRVKIEVY